MAFAVYVVLTVLLLVATVIPLLPLAHGIARVGDFPRQQFLGLALALLAAAPLFAEFTVGWLVILLSIIATALTHARLILPFTPLARNQSVGFDPQHDNGDRFRLVAANVKMSNEKREAFRREIEQADPDILVLMEIDESWDEALRPLTRRYRHVVSKPQDNSYGILLASRLEIAETTVGCLLTDGVPSVITTVKTPSGLCFRLYAIHPEPPVPHRGSEGRDGETALVALRVREETTPVVVTGDLNDVAWSRTTRRFRRVSRLLDPRIGRMVFSTFDARLPLLRWPLDHLFHSAEFRLVAMRRLRPRGSDHFPVAFDLALCREPKAEATPEPASAEDLERALRLVREAAMREETPIGSDWEK